MQINPYLHFDGNCQEAMGFYKDILGGELTIMTIGESPMAKDMPEAKDKIMHASLMKDGAVLLLAADMMNPSQFTKGDTISISLNNSDEEESKAIFEKLSEGGDVFMPLDEQFWGALFGMVTDKFGMEWMVNCDKKKPM